MNQRLLSCAFYLLPLAACTFAPEAAQPTVALPTTFRHAPADATAVDHAAWWRQFDDPALTRHIETALAHNLDLATAAAVLSEYEALYSAAAGGTGPQLKLESTAQRGRAVGVTTNNYQFATNASWEIDFWGKLRNTRAAARAELLAQSASREALRLVVISTVANGYIELRELDQRLAISQRTLTGRQRSLQLAQARFKAGMVSRIDQRQAESEYQSIVLQVLQLEQSVEQKENALSLLVGRNPASLERGRTLGALAIPAIPAGLPSGLLARRPDLLQAAEQLSAAVANVGVARAGTYPSISLTGSLGGASSQLSSLFSGGAGTWAFAPALNFPLFDGGQSRAKVDVARARLQQAELAYQKAVRSALRDTEDALLAVEKTRAQEQAQAAQVVALLSYEQLARRRYEGGVTSYLELLDAQRALLAGEIALAQTHSAALQSIVALYRALGGDWTPAPLSAAPASR